MKGGNIEKLKFFQAINNSKYKKLFFSITFSILKTEVYLCPNHDHLLHLLCCRYSLLL